jgi:hypothetical protein
VENKNGNQIHNRRNEPTVSAVQVTQVTQNDPFLKKCRLGRPRIRAQRNPVQRDATEKYLDLLLPFASA